jgi:hypothetical protein
MSDVRRTPASETEIRHLLGEAQRELAEIDVDRRAMEEVFRTRVRSLLERTTDAEAQNDIWDYLEGKIERRVLRRRPAFAALWAADRDAALARLQNDRVTDFIAAYLTGIGAQGSARTAPEARR